MSAPMSSLTQRKLLILHQTVFSTALCAVTGDLQGSSPHTDLVADGQAQTVPGAEVIAENKAEAGPTDEPWRASQIGNSDTPDSESGLGPQGPQPEDQEGDPDAGAQAHQAARHVAGSSEVGFKLLYNSDISQHGADVASLRTLVTQ